MGILFLFHHLETMSHPMSMCSYFEVEGGTFCQVMYETQTFSVTLTKSGWSLFKYNELIWSQHVKGRNCKVLGSDNL